MIGLLRDSSLHTNRGGCDGMRALSHTHTYHPATNPKNATIRAVSLMDGKYVQQHSQMYRESGEYY